MNPNRMVQLAALAVMAGALTGSALLQGAIDLQRRELELVVLDVDRQPVQDAKTALLQLLPGGLKAPAVNYFYIRSQKLKEDGRFFDAKQVRQMICDLMPRFSGVWSNLSWDMAWNISVATHTPEERWMWVNNGVSIIRDRGLLYNPRDLVLYRQLAWVYSSKMGDTLDDMHRYYKLQQAQEMDQLLGAPPEGGDVAEWAAAIERIAAAPDLDHLADDQQAAGFLNELLAHKLTADDEFLLLYNRFNRLAWMNGRPCDRLVGTFLTNPAAPATPREQALEALLVNPEHAAGRDKALAAVRRDRLIHRYRLDPRWMVKLMRRYGPLDWRIVHTHALYWASYGLWRSLNLELEDLHPGLAENELEKLSRGRILPSMHDFHRLNTERIVLQSLRSLSRSGQLHVFLYGNPKTGRQVVETDWGPDYRFIPIVNREYREGGAALAGGMDKIHLEENTLRDGHSVYLQDCIMILYLAGMEKDAAEYFRQLKEDLKFTHPTLEDDPPLDEYVRRLTVNLGSLSTDLARVFWMGGLRASYRAAIYDRPQEASQYYALAWKAYQAYLRDTASIRRLTPTPFEIQERNFLVALLTRPEALRLNVPLLARSKVYNQLHPFKQQLVWPLVKGRLEELCRQEQLDFAKAFPPPPPPQPAEGAASQPAGG